MLNQSSIDTFDFICRSIRYGLGFIGNILSLMILCSFDEFRQVSTGSLFLFITTTNSIHLWTLTTEFLTEYNIYVYSHAFLQCRLNFFVQNVSRAMSTYLAIGIALDRFIRTEIPLRSRMIWTRRHVFIYTGMNFFVFSLLWLFWLCPKIVRDTITSKCIFTTPTLSLVISHIQAPIRMILVCMIPVIVMAMANLRMLHNLRRSRCLVENAMRRPTTTQVPTITCLTTNNFSSRRMSAIDRMLFYVILVNVGTFIITQILFHIYATVRSYNLAFDRLTHILLRAMLLIWSSIYFGIGFYVHCLASPLFRD
jgi:hypothetical protein